MKLPTKKPSTIGQQHAKRCWVLAKTLNNATTMDRSILLLAIAHEFDRVLNRPLLRRIPMMRLLDEVKRRAEKDITKE